MMGRLSTSSCRTRWPSRQRHLAPPSSAMPDESWTMHFADGGAATMPIQYAHPILTLQPVNPEHIAHLDYRQVLLHNDLPYEPPTYGDVYNYVPVDVDSLWSTLTGVQGARFLPGVPTSSLLLPTDGITA